MKKAQFTLIALLAASRVAFADATLNLTRGVSPLSRDVYQLHMIIFTICVIIGLIVFGVMLYSILYHRKSLGVKPAQFHTHFWLEITWTVVPMLILAVMAVPATRVLMKMNNFDQDDLTIRVTGYQWKWHYEYLEEGVSFFSTWASQGKPYLRQVDHPLVLPVHQKIRFLMTSNDVNHAWWVPDLAVKRDALPGFINEGWTVIDKPGTYYGQCAELCGIHHAYMPIVVIAVSKQGYLDWIQKQKQSNGAYVPLTQANVQVAEPLPNVVTANKAAPVVDDMKAAMLRGEKVYDSNCAVCHQPNGEGMPPTFPAINGSKIVTGPVTEHIDRVLNGKPGTAMMAFRNQLDDQSLADVITFERNAWQNHTGTWVKQEDIKAAKTLPPKG